MPNSLHYAVGPSIALVAVVGLLFGCRWAFSPTRAQRARRAADRTKRDFGLLVPVATVGRESDAQLLRDRLSAHGIRATSAMVPPGPVQVSPDGHVRKAGPGGWQVLVFAVDTEDARRVVSRSA